MRQAVPADVDLIMELRADAAEWLARVIGSDQWAEPWHGQDGMRCDILASIQRDETWMVTDEHGRTIGTLALDDWTAPGLWTADKMAEPARYIHRMIIDRDHAGKQVGARMLDWASQQAAQAGARWLRADVWTDNTGLHRYYRNQGFTHVRTVRRDDYPSGALFQRHT